MKIDLGMTYKEKREASEKWHRWFAWHPVRLGGSHEGRWLEVIERRYLGSTWEGESVYEYRAKNGQ